MILIIDNNSKFLKNLEGILSKKKIGYYVVKHDKFIDLGSLKSIKGVILTGGSAGIYRKSIANDFISLLSFDVPVLGICLGHQIISIGFGGLMSKCKEKQDKIQEIKIFPKKDPIFKGFDDVISLREKHSYYIKRTPDNFMIIAGSDKCKVEAIKHKRRPIYGFQAHPEMSGEDGEKLIKNFLDICKEKYVDW